MRTGWDKSEIRHGGGSASRRVLLCALIALACVCAFALAGCKYSDVLTQHTEDPAAEIDENAEPIYESNPDSDLVMDLANLSIDEAEDQDSQVAKLPHYDPDAPDNGETKQLKKSNQTPHDEEASEGQEDGDSDREGEGAGDQGGDSTNNNKGDGEGQDEGDGEQLKDDDSDEASESETGTTGDDQVIVDPDDGTNDETAKGTIAAPGEYATIAQMLGGAGALAACDQGWLDACSSKGIFPGELERVKVAFSGNEEDGYTCDVNALISAGPSVVLYDGKNGKIKLSASDISAIEAAGITVQDVPRIGKQGTEDYTVKAAVAQVASVLTGASGLQYDVSDVLSRYNSFHDEALKTCYDANGGFSYKVTDDSYNQLYQNTPLSGLSDSTTNRVITVYVDSMYDPGVSAATVAQTATTSSGIITLEHDGDTLEVNGDVCLSATRDEQYMLIDYYLQLAGAMNNAYDASSPDPSGLPYILMPGNTPAFGSSNNFAGRSTGTAFFFSGGDGTVAANWHSLGDSDFNTVLVASEEIADAMAASAAKPKGLYNMGKSYQIVVVPSGVSGAWSEGHLDSFLLAPWAFRIQDAASLSTAESYVSNFYSTFLRCGDWKKAVTDWDYSKAGA